MYNIVLLAAELKPIICNLHVPGAPAVMLLMLAVNPPQMHKLLMLQRIATNYSTTWQPVIAFPLAFIQMTEPLINAAHHAACDTAQVDTSHDAAID